MTVKIKRKSERDYKNLSIFSLCLLTPIRKKIKKAINFTKIIVVRAEVSQFQDTFVC